MSPLFPKRNFSMIPNLDNNHLLNINKELLKKNQNKIVSKNLDSN